MELKIIDSDDDITQVALSGRLDVTGAEAINLRFHAATAVPGKSTVVDLSELEFIASLGIGLLFGCARSLHGKGKKMVLVNPQALVAQALKTARMESVMPIVSTHDEAIRALE